MPKPFVKGDKRINRKGRPKSFDALRSLAQSIAHEEVTNAKGETASVTEAILRQWAASKDPRLQMHFMEVAYGKVPQVNEVTGKGGGPVETREISLDDAERADRIIALLDKARARRDKPPDSPGEQEQSN